jgi:alpha-ketoglutarate-dependent taurine dioxygenase
MAVARFEPLQYRIWHKERITRELESIKYKDYMKDDKILHRALLFLNTHGLLILKGVPESETAVEDIASRMGKLRDTFYGRTWDVKSVPEAKNVAYTHQYLGLHMDLLYMANPPGFQLLHCLKNTCEGGSSLFADAFQAAYQLSRRDFNSLCGFKVAYQYKNAGEHYYFSHRVIEEKQYAVDTPYGMRKAITQVNWSPPFQADLATAQEQHYLFPQVLLSLRAFAKNVEAPENLYEYKMQEGDCVIFNNRRVLHGRREFDATGGERWLKGAYVDTDVFMSRWRVLNEKFEEHGQKIYQGLVDKEVHKEITPEKKNVNNYGPPFKRKAEIKAEMEAEREAETKLNPPL